MLRADLMLASGHVKYNIAIRLPVHNYEIDFELTYLAQILPGFVVRPGFRYIFHPGGGGPNPFNPALGHTTVPGRIPDAAVFGIRTAIKF